MDRERNIPELIEALLNRAANARREETATALGDALHFEEAAAALSAGLEVATPPSGEREVEPDLIERARALLLALRPTELGSDVLTKWNALFDAVMASQKAPSPDREAAIRREALEEAARVARNLRHPFGKSSESSDWCDGTLHVASAIRALIATSDKGGARG